MCRADTSISVFETSFFEAEIPILRLSIHGLCTKNTYRSVNLRRSLEMLLWLTSGER